MGVVMTRENQEDGAAMTGQRSVSFFGNTGAQDLGPRRQRETAWKYLQRSSEPEAVAARTRWDNWLTRMPAGQARDELIRRLQDREDTQVSAALAELVTFILLDSVYPVVELQPAAGPASHTDFAVTLPSRTHLEVRRTVAPVADRKDAQRRRAIAAELEKIPSPDFWLAINVDIGPEIPSMRPVRKQIESWLTSLNYGTERQRLDAEHQRRQGRAANDSPPGLDAPPAERAAYYDAGTQPYEPPLQTWSGPGWSVAVEAVPRSASLRGQNGGTVGVSISGAVHLESAEALRSSVRAKVSQHAGLVDPLVVVFDVSSPMPADDEIAAMLYGPATATAGPSGISVSRDRSRGLWPGQPPPQPVAVLILKGVTLGQEHHAAAELWLPPGSSSPLLPGPWTTRTLGLGGLPTPPLVAATSIAGVLGP